MKRDTEVIEVGKKDNTTDFTEKTGYVKLPYADHDFKDFIVGLLGEPQSIEGKFIGNFIIDKKTIINFFQLIDQRISQQNEAFLAGFIVKVVYNDKSLVTLNSFEDFATYNEVNSITPVTVELILTYMIRFQDKKYPEKQEISVTILTDKDLDDYYEYSFFEFSNMRYGSIRYKIAHTARSWGIDMQNLLTNHIETIIEEPNKVKRFLFKHRTSVSAILGLVTFVGLLIAVHGLMNRYNTLAYSENTKVIQSVPNDIHAKLDLILRSLAFGIFSKAEDLLSIAVFISFFISIGIIIMAFISLQNNESSYILFTDQSIKDKEKRERKGKRKWLTFCLSAVMSIVLGIISNVIFQLINI